jgi:hypothetical protein
MDAAVSAVVQFDPIRAPVYLVLEAELIAGHHLVDAKSVCRRGIQQLLRLFAGGTGSQNA